MSVLESWSILKGDGGSGNPIMWKSLNCLFFYEKSVSLGGNIVHGRKLYLVSNVKKISVYYNVQKQKIKVHW